MAGTLIQVAVVLAALFAVPPPAEAAPGLGSVFAPRGTQPPSEAGGFDPFGFPKQVIAALTPCRPGGDSGEASGKCAPRRPADQHLHHHAQQPTAATPLASRSGTPAAAPAAKPAAAPAAAPGANPAARPAANPAASPAATPAATTTSTAAPSTAAPTASERMEPTGPMAKAPVTDECLLAYQKLTNGTTDEEDFDILSVLLDYGGFPGQVSNIKWEKNATEGRPNRWTYFYGDTDYKTYIRLERGAVNSTRTPTRGTTPEEIQGDIYWSPKNFCGKLRHSKYTQAPLSESPDRRPRISSETQPEICSIGDSRKGKTLRCSGFLADKAPLGPALLATLIG